MDSTATAPIAQSLSTHQDAEKIVTVTLSNALVRLLSEQLYQSPLKAIEELVVNAYDATASTCRIFVPLPTDTENEFIAVYDDGFGMNYEGLADLWQIGRSKKRNEEIELRSQRKQIGKFGIGKLATYTIANQLTYITKTGESILGVTIDFRVFKDKQAEDLSNSNAKDTKLLEHDDSTSQDKKKLENNDNSARNGRIEPIKLPVYEIEDWHFFAQTDVSIVLGALGLETQELETHSWTIAILENLKEKSQNIRLA